MKEARQKAEILIQAIRYIKKFKHKTIVIKYGGNAMKDTALKNSVFEDIAMLRSMGVEVVVVHGGGPEIDRRVNEQGLKTKRVEGLRVTDDATLKVVRQVLSDINKECLEHLKNHGAKAEDCTEGLLATEITDPKLGFVGEVTGVNTGFIKEALNRGVIPVISCLGRDNKGKLTNINADTAATHIAQALNAEKLTILTNVDAVLDEDSQPISHLNAEQAQRYIKLGVINQGMTPKIRACINAVESGVRKTHLLNGTTPRALLLEIFTEEGIGTELVKT
jgi:acetylglutamate kinase